MKPVGAIKKFVSEDCCNTGRFYAPATAREIKEFKESCTPEEWEKMGQDAIEHLAKHGIE